MKKYLKESALITGMSLVMVIAQNAQATTYTVDLDGPLGNSGAGYLTDYKSIYNDTNGTLTFSSRFTEKNGKLANGFWLVVNGGGAANDATNPKGHSDQLAILYGDHTSQRLTAYVYNGQNNASSYSESGAFIESFTSELLSTYTNGVGANDGISTFDFTIDLGLINDPTGKPSGWRGVQYTEEVGIWFHPFFANDGAITYSADGSIASFSTRYTGWFDTNGTPTTVPEPADMGLMLVGFAGLVFCRRKRMINNSVVK